MRDINNAIWMFGGSTTFGYGVSDSETIPALLEAKLNKHVINFGRGYFYSAQENLLLRHLLKAGYNPEEVLFLDGINETCDINTYQEELKQLFSKAQHVYGWTIADLATPLIFLVEKIKLKFFGLKKKYDNFECSLYGNKQPLSDILRKNMLERKNLCEQYALKCTTFVQPFAGVHGIHKDYISWPHDSRDQFKNNFNLLKSTF